MLDACILEIHTPSISFQSVKTVENAEKNGKVIEKWVRDISELHRSKPPPTVHYNKLVSLRRAVPRLPHPQ